MLFYKKVKIGQEIVNSEEFEIQKLVSGTKVTVKKGDKGVVDSKGLLHYTSGEANGMIQKIDGMKVDGYDHRNIANMVFNHLKGYFDLSDYLESYDIEEERVLDEIEAVLMDIL